MYFICIKLLFFFDLKKSGLIFDFTGLAGGALSRPFGTGTGGIDADPLKSEAQIRLTKYGINDETHWDNGVKLLWDDIVSMAKDGRFEKVETTLAKGCKMEDWQAAPMAQWFLDNFKEAGGATEQGLSYFVCFFLLLVSRVLFEFS